MISCRNGAPAADSSKKNSIVVEDMCQIVQPRYGMKIREGDEMAIEVKLDKSVDSVVVTTDNGQRIGTLLPDLASIKWIANAEKLGTKNINFQVFSGSSKGNRTLKIMLLDKKSPSNFSYRVVKIYPHATHAYTQGLIFDNGILYESDGQYGMSALRKVQIETGKTLQQYSLSNKYFAEGIAMLGNKIYQLTWRENTCFVYDKENLQLIDQKTYDIAEGWGLATDGKLLYMTDGSNKVYTIEPESFSVVDMFEVVDDKGAVDNLNELEYVDGWLYANVYQTDDVVIIDLQRKRLVGKINFAHLLKPSDYQANTDVLNGIAYNPQSKRFYITGKNWPKLFEVEITGTLKKK